MDDFDRFLEDKIIPELKPLEEKRKYLSAAMLLSLLIIIGIGIGTSIITVNFSSFSFFSLFFGSIFLILYCYAFYQFLVIIGLVLWYKGYKTEFSAKIIGNIVKFIDKDLEYSEDEYISKEDYNVSGLFPTHYNGYTGADLVSGKLGKTIIKFSYLYTFFREVHRDKDGHTTETIKTIFKGLFFIADFNKKFSDIVYVLPHKFEFLSPLRSHKITLEDPDFNKNFDVYGSDPVVSRYIISTSLMKRLLDFKNKIKSNFSISFINSNIYIAISGYKSFSIPFFKTLYNKNIYYNYLNQLIFATDIVNSLNLDTRIWTY